MYYFLFVAERLSTKDSFFHQNTNRSAITLLEDAISGEGVKRWGYPGWCVQEVKVSQTLLSCALLSFTTMEVTCPASILGESNSSAKCQCTSMWHCKDWDKGCFIISVQGQGHRNTEDPPSFENFKPQLDMALSTRCSSAVLQFE